MPLPQDGNEVGHGDDERRHSEDCQDKTIQGNPPLFPRRLGEHRLLVAPVYQIPNMCSSMFWSALLGAHPESQPPAAPYPPSLWLQSGCG